MEPRLDSPAQALPGVLSALQKLSATAHHSDVPRTTLLLIEVRASQINGCSVCLDMHTRELRNEGESDQRIFMVGAWREAPYFTDAERAALGLTESMTRLADQSDPVPDEVWEEAARHYDEQQLAALVVAISSIYTWNRINAATRQITGDWVTQFIPAPQAA
jgi:AhpD family alkylhydroperoxidase